jgi:hypothetical protein
MAAYTSVFAGDLSQSLSLAAVMGSGFAEMAKNLSLSLRQGRVRIAMGVFELASSAEAHRHPLTAIGS